MAIFALLIESTVELPTARQIIVTLTNFLKGLKKCFIQKVENIVQSWLFFDPRSAWSKESHKFVECCVRNK